MDRETMVHKRWEDRLLRVTKTMNNAAYLILEPSAIIHIENMNPEAHTLKSRSLFEDAHGLGEKRLRSLDECMITPKIFTSTDDMYEIDENFSKSRHPVSDLTNNWRMRYHYQRSFFFLRGYTAACRHPLPGCSIPVH